MSLIIFEDKVNFLTIGTPSTGYFVGYDIDGYLKQKDMFGVIKIIGLGSTSSGGSTQSLSDTLLIGNTTGTSDIILSDNTIIKNSSSDSKIILDYSTNNDVFIQNKNNESSLLLGKENIQIKNSTSNATMSFEAGTHSQISLGKSIGVNITSNNSYISLDGENKKMVINILSDDLKINHLTSTSADKAPIILSSKNTTISSGVKNVVVVGGDSINATQSGLYVDNEYVKGKIAGVDGSGQIKINTDVELKNNNNLITLRDSSSFYLLDKNGLILIDSLNTFTSPNLDSGVMFLNNKNSTLTPNIKNTIVIGGENISVTQSDFIYLGTTVSIAGNYRLPMNDGVSNQTLITDGLGNLTWTNITSNVSLSLFDVLSVGNDSNTKNIIMGTATSIKTSRGGGQIDLDKSLNEILISNDNGSKFSSYIDLSQQGITFSSLSTTTPTIIFKASDSITNSNQFLSITSSGVLISGTGSLDIRNNKPQLKLSNNSGGFNLIQTTASNTNKFHYRLPINTGTPSNLMFISSTFSGDDSSWGYNLSHGTIRDIGGVKFDAYNNIGNVSGSITWDMDNSTNYEVTLIGNMSLNLTNVRNGHYGTIIVKQDTVGGRTLTLSFVNGSVANHKVVNAQNGTVTLTGTANAIDILSYTYNGSVLYWTIGNSYS